MPSDSDSDEDFKPKAKKVKTSKAEEDEDEDDEEDEEENGEEEVKRDDDGNAYFDLAGNKKRCTVKKWKSAVLVDIREFYEKGGKTLPGRKGISLTLAQYKELKSLIEDGTLDKQIKELKG